MTICLIAAFTI